MRSPPAERARRYRAPPRQNRAGCSSKNERSPLSIRPGLRPERAACRSDRSRGVGLLLWPWLAGSWPGATYTSAPLKLPAGIFGMGHGAGAHAPDEYFLIDSANPKVAGLDGAVRLFVDLFYTLS